jgi:hypothetical protein
MHPRFTIAHMMLAIAILAMLLAGVTLVSMETVVGLIASLALATPIWLIESEMRSLDSAPPSRLQTWVFRVYVGIAVIFLVISALLFHPFK